MNISRVLRVILTIIVVLGFIVVTIATYRRNRRVDSMITLSDATNSITTVLTSQKLAWKDRNGIKHPYVLDRRKLENQKFNEMISEENFVFQISVTYQRDNGEKVKVGKYGPSPDNGQMTCSLKVPTAFRTNGRALPAKMRVIVWYA